MRTTSDCVDDQWFLTRVLLDLTSSRPGTVVNVQDEDGEFLLIQAAESLPNWLTPDTSNNRVWLYLGHLHIIPFHHRLSDPSEGGNREALAISLVRDDRIQTSADPEVERLAFERLRLYPQEASDHHHQCLAFLPAGAARLISSRPQIISKVVESLSTRDVVSLRACQKMARFGPLSQPEDRGTKGSSNQETTMEGTKDAKFGTSGGWDDKNKVGLYRVRMTRNLYAQLTYDRLFPPKAFGSEWQEQVEKYRIFLSGNPSSSHQQEQQEQGRNQQVSSSTQDSDKEIQMGKWRDLGSKITCGLEMLYQQSLERKSRSKRKRSDRVRSIFSRPRSTTGTLPEVEDEGEEERRMRNDPEYPKFVESLKRMGYFEREIQDSLRWKELERSALKTWVKMERSKGSSSSTRLNRSRRNPTMTGGEGGGSFSQEEIQSENEEEDEEEEEDVAEMIDSTLSTSASTPDPQPLCLDRPDQLEQDPEDWLNVTLQDLEEMFNHPSKEKASISNLYQGEGMTQEEREEREERKVVEELDRFANKMEGFVEREGDFEGVRFREEELDDLLDEEEEEEEEEEDDEDEDEEVKREKDRIARTKAREMISSMSVEQRYSAMEKLVAGIQPTEWGSNVAQPFQAESHRVGGVQSERTDEGRRGGGSSRLAQSLDREQERRRRSKETSEEEGEVSNQLVKGNDGNDFEEQERRRRVKEEMKRDSRWLSSQEIHYEGDSDSDRESLMDDSMDPEEDRKNRDRWLGLEREDLERSKRGKQAEDDDDEDHEIEFDHVDDDDDEEGEMKRFLEFTRKALGLSPEQYDMILNERKERGAFVPKFQNGGSSEQNKNKNDKEDKLKSPPSKPSRSPGTTKSARVDESPPQPPPSNKPKSKQQRQEGTELDTFEKVMSAMERKLDEKKKTSNPTSMEEEEEETLLRSQDQELVSKLVPSSSSSSSSQELKLNLVENFLRSFQSQNGEAGPVSNLAHSLGVRPLPRDDDMDVDF
ncbi:hypothetical protein IE53DRAFT_131144 [Violaceomyces palustris]|uniref:Uncharacterized protein n=1 Tax=Violaceomyces palustris TaxID=1673888 RepID=A0ACD0NVF6_9BASI|nr:hypothetical protein IE53DRAFT_131144 [Violaceomyces palustris]